MDPQSNEFEKLKALLALKRHEQPPPGYFDSFSSKVVARIEAEARVPETAWWHRWIRPSLVSPVLTCAYGVVVASLLVLGINWAWHLERQAADESGDDQWAPGALPMPANGPMEAAYPQAGNSLQVSETGTNPPGSLLASNSPFNVPPLPVERARFQTEGR